MDKSLTNKIMSDIEHFGYHKISKEKCINLSAFIVKNGLISFPASHDILYLVPGYGGGYVKTSTIKKVFVDGMNLGEVKTSNDIKENLVNLIIGFNILEEYINSSKYIIINKKYDFNDVLIDLSPQINLSFRTFGLMVVSGNIIETDNVIYILENEEISKSELYYKYLILSDTTKKEVKILTYSWNQRLIIRSYSIEGFRFNLEQKDEFILENFKVNYEFFAIKMKKLETVKSYEIFPQADNIDLIFELIQRLEQVTYERSDIAKLIDSITGGMVDRQISYYLSALLFLKILVEDENGRYNLSFSLINAKKGSIVDLKEFVALRILEHRIFYLVFEHYIEKNKMMKNSLIADYIQTEYMIDLERSTAMRRASTVRNWVRWINMILYYPKK